MGVGNYRDRFGDAGETFYVDAPDLSDEAYNAYAEDADEPMDVDTWREVESHDSWSGLKDSIAASLKDLGFERVRGERRGRGAPWDDFATVASDGLVAVGVLDWEGYGVVGVAAHPSLLDMAMEPDANVGEILDGFALLPSEFPGRIGALASKVAERVRIALADDGFSLRRRTGAWTSSGIEPVADPVSAASALSREIVTMQGVLREGWAASKLSDPGPRRDAFVKAMYDTSLAGASTNARLVAFAFVDGKAQGFDPTTGRIQHGLSFDAPDFLREAAETDPGSVLVVSSEDGDDGLAFLRLAVDEILARHEGAFPVFCDEFERVTGVEPDCGHVEDLVTQAARSPSP